MDFGKTDVEPTLFASVQRQKLTYYGHALRSEETH